MYFRRKQSQGRIYLQIVESHRSGDQVRQRVIATLGRLDELEATGQLAPGYPGCGKGYDGMPLGALGLDERAQDRE